jgi:hypothetical protein
MKEKILKGVLDATFFAGKVLVGSAKYTGKYIYDHRNEIGGAAKGFAKGTVNIASDLYGHTKTEVDFNEKFEELKRQSEEFCALQRRLQAEKCNKEILLDSLGITFTFANNYLWVESVPNEILEAYSSAYPDLAEKESLDAVVNRMSEEELSGIVSGIKGKLFEQRYIEYLNDGNLPDGYEAILADSPTNPGWDIAILDENGKLDDVLQLKATESLDYIKDALVRYPDIKVVTTDEVYCHLTMHGISENVINSGISNDEITMLVENSLESVNDVDVCFGPPVIPALIIGYSVYKKENLTKFEKGEEFGKRFCESYIATIVGGAALCVCNFWLVGLATALGTKYYLYKGRRKKTLYDGLCDNIKYNQKIIDDLRSSL